MKILHLSARYPPPVSGGLDRQVYGLVHALHRAGHDVAVCANVPDNAAATVPVYGTADVSNLLPILELSSLARVNISLQSGLHRALADGHWDVLHAHDWMVAPAAVAFQRSTGIPVVTTFHADTGAENIGTQDDRLRRLDWEAAIVGVSKHVLVPGRHLIRAIRSRYPDCAVAHVPNGFHFSDFAAPIVEDTTLSPYMLYAGRLVSGKGVDTVIRALAILRDSAPHLRLVIAGEGYYRAELERLVEELHLCDAITFLGWLDDAKARQTMLGASIFVAPSKSEAFGLSVIEAMASGRPIIASDIPAHHELIDHEATGLLVNQHDERLWAAAISRLLTAPKVGQFLARNAQQSVRERYDWPAIIEKTIDVYKSIDHATA